MNLKPTFQSERGDSIGSLFAPKRLSSKRLFAVCQHLRNSIKYLYETGFEVMFQGRPQRIFARVLCITGDNQFMNYFFGLQGSFSSGKVCRFCTIDHKQIVFNFSCKR